MQENCHGAGKLPRSRKIATALACVSFAKIYRPFACLVSANTTSNGYVCFKTKTQIPHLNHKTPLFFIFGNMNTRFIYNFFYDIGYNIRRNRKSFLFCCAVALVATVLGVVLFKISDYNWWYSNRCDFIFKIVYGGFFSVFIAFVVSSAIICLLCFATLWKRWLGYVALFAICLYFGANCAAAVAFAGFLGALYLIVLVSGQLLNMLCVFLAICQCCDVSDFLQAVKEGKNIIVLQVCGVCVKLLVIFALLRVLTTLI